MNYEQLKPPILATLGQDDLCLDYVTRFFGIPDKYDTATDAWNVTQYKHTTQPPSTNISVPIWFSWTGTVDGVTQDWGHVAGWVNGEVYSTTAQGDKVFDSVQALITYIGEGITYRGWSEDINGVRVVQPQGDTDMIADVAHLNAMFMAFHGVPSTAAEQAEYLGPNQPDINVLIERLNDSTNPQWQAWHKVIQAGIDSTETVTQLNSGLYRV